MRIEVRGEVLMGIGGVQLVWVTIVLGDVCVLVFLYEGE